VSAGPISPSSQESAPLRLREAVEADLPELVQVLQQAFAEYQDKLDPPSSAQDETVDRLRAVLRSSHAVVAELEGAIVGCVFYAPIGDHVDLFRLAVLPVQRRRGIAQALIRYVEDRTRELGLSRVQLGVRIALTRNRDYYERLGYRFVEARSHAGYSKPTFVILEKRVDCIPPDVAE
jgi:predicted N-acetyltransferase YhbS